MSILVFRFLLVLVGSFIISLGSTLMITVSQLGLHPFDVLEYALTQKFGLTFGKWHWIVGAIIGLSAYFVNRKVPKIGVFLDAFLVGAFIDFLLWTNWIPIVHHYILEGIYLIIGICLVGFGTGMYIAADLGAGPSDWFSLAVAERTGFSYSKTTTFTEISAVILGFILNGPIFIGTLLFSLFYGPIMVFSLKIWKQNVRVVRKRILKL